MAKAKAVKKLTKKLKEYLEEYATGADMDAPALKHNVQQWLNKTPKERTEVIKKFGGRGWHERNAIDPIKAFKVDSPKASLTERASVPDVIRSIKKGDAVMKKGGHAVKARRKSNPRGVGAATHGYGRVSR